MDPTTAAAASGDIPAYWTDLAVVGILLVSGLLALFRGLVREVMSLGNWLGALAITAALADKLKDQFSPAVGRMMAKHQDTLGSAAGKLNEILPYVFAAITVFVVSLAVLSLITHFIAKALENSPLGPINRSLGFVFGLLRGWLVVSLVFLIFTWLYPDPRQQPRWLAEAKTNGMMASGAETLQGLLPADLALPVMDKLDEKLGIAKREDTPPDLLAPSPIPDGPAAEPGEAAIPPAAPGRGATSVGSGRSALGGQAAPTPDALSRMEVLPSGAIREDEDRGYDSRARSELDQLSGSMEE